MWRVCSYNNIHFFQDFTSGLRDLAASRVAVGGAVAPAFVASGRSCLRYAIMLPYLSLISQSQSKSRVSKSRTS